MIKISLWLSIIFFSVCSIWGSSFGPIGSLLGLIWGLFLSFVFLSAIFRRVNSRWPKEETSGVPEIRHAMRFPFINCIWGPLSLLAGAMIYGIVSSIMAAFSMRMFAPPLQADTDILLLRGLLQTVDNVLAASPIGIAIAATLAFFTALIRKRRDVLSVSGLAWAPVLAGAMPYFIIAFGLGRTAEIWFAATAVTLASLPCFIRANDEIASSPLATGRIVFFVLEAVYVSLLSGLAAVILIEFIGGRDGVGYLISQSIMLFDTARAVAGIFLVWQFAAVLSFVVRLTQGFVVEVLMAEDRPR